MINFRLNDNFDGKYKDQLDFNQVSVDPVIINLLSNNNYCQYFLYLYRYNNKDNKFLILFKLYIINLTYSFYFNLYYFIFWFFLMFSFLMVEYLDINLTKFI